MPMKLVMLPPQSATSRDWAARLGASLKDYSIVVPENEQQAGAEIVDADAALGTLPLALLRKAGRLRWLQVPQAAPPEGFYYPELIAHPLVVTNLRDVQYDHIGAHIMAFILAFSRGLQRYFPQQLRREWSPAPRDQGVVHLPEASVLIVGAGAVGGEAGRLVAAFGARVIGVDARRTDVPPGFAEMHPADALDSLLPQADFVILTVPHTPVTEGFFNRARFRRMKRSAFFINIGRGKTTPLKDLVAALEAGEIAGAGLDVYEQDPLPADYPLWTMPGVILTPHTAGYGPYTFERRFQIVLENCRRFAAGQPLRNLVDKKNWF